jgi:predicted TPR repeat methyltransferase
MPVLEMPPMTEQTNATLHDAYAADYDDQVRAYDCHVADLLFGLCYEFTRPGQSLLDLGIGSGLSARPFAQAGLTISGMDFSPAMLNICRAKGFAADLTQHDLSQFPWPYPSARFDHVICCGVLHFIPALDGVFGEVTRVLAPGGLFAFTTRLPSTTDSLQPWEQQRTGQFAIYAHAPAYVETLLAQHGFRRRKRQKCYVGDDLFVLWVVARQPHHKDET